MSLTALAMTDPTHGLVQWVLALLFYAGPLVVVAVALVLCVGAYRRDLARRTRYLARAEAHMDRMEAKTDRMITLLDCIDRNLGDRTSN